MTNREPLSYLVGIDASDSSLEALRWACQLAENTGARVDALTAWSFPSSTMTPFVSGPAVPFELFEEVARQRLATTVEVADSSSVASQTIVCGHPGSILVDRSKDYDLIVVGRTGRGRLARMVIGSTARFIARNSACPVVIVNGTGDIERIIVAIDGSPNSVGALRWASSIDETLPILAVYSHDERVLEDLPFGSPIRAELSLRANIVVDDTIALSEVDPARITTEVRAGDPRTTIVDRASSAELLVLGGCGRGVLDRIVGSLASYAIEHTSGPVAIWRDRS